MPETRELLDAEEWAVYAAAPTRRQVPWLKMQQLLAGADLPDAQALLMDTWLQRCDAEADAVARFRSTALPYNLTLLSTGFIQIWVMLLPVGYISDWWALFFYFWLSLVLLACDELATQLEVRMRQRRGLWRAVHALAKEEMGRCPAPFPQRWASPHPAGAHDLPHLSAAGPLCLPALPGHPERASAGCAEVSAGSCAASGLLAAARLRDYVAAPCPSSAAIASAPSCRVINDGIALQKIADRPRAAMGYVSDRQVDPDEIEVPLRPKAAVTAHGLL